MKDELKLTDFCGVYFNGDGATKFWRITCPCGVTVEYPVNGFPEIDTLHPCGKSNHWTVKYADDAILSPESYIDQATRLNG